MISDSNNIDLIIELWSRLRPHVTAKERLEVADIIVSVFDDFGLVDGLEEEVELDKELKAAVKSHFGTVAEDEDDEY